MNSRLKGIVTVILIVIIGLVAVSGIGYIRQRMAEDQGVKYLKQKEYQKAYEEFDSAASRFTLIFTKQKKNVLFYEGEALYQMGEYNKAAEIYCLMQRNKTKEALEVCNLGISEFPKEGEIYCTKYAIYAKQEKYKEGLQVIKKALKQDELKNKKEVLFARISAYESLFDFDTAYKYTKAYVKAYPKDAQGKKELTFLETR